MNPKSYAIRRPYLFSTLIILLIVAVYLLAGTAVYLLQRSGSDFTLYLIANVVLTLVFIAILTGMRCWKRTGFQALPNRRDLWLYALPLLPVLGNLVFGIQTHELRSVLTFFVLAALIGFVEETAFRGLILQALAPRGLWKAAIISAVLFGLVHSMNALSGSDPAYILLQIGYAMAFGFGWACVTLRTRVIWPLVIIHALIDFTSFMAVDLTGEPVFDAYVLGISAVFIVVFTIYGIFMLRLTRQPAQILSASPAQS